MTKTTPVTAPEARSAALILLNNHYGLDAAKLGTGELIAVAYLIQVLIQTTEAK